VKNQRRKTPGSRESIERALTHHRERGGVVGFSAPGVLHPTKWVVTLNGLGPDYFTDAEAKAVCLGLAAADRAAEAKGKPH
jgi:hypothetical protein